MKFCLYACVLVVWLGWATGSLQKGSEYTNSLGQEVLEIRNPIKDLPPDLEEEPSAESDSGEEVFSRTTTTIPPATKKDVPARKSGGGVMFQNRRGKPKDIEKIDNIKREDEEAKIEKELADIYKDPDYNLASSEEALKNAKQNITVTVNKPVPKPLVRNQNTITKETKAPNQNTVYAFQPKNLADKTEVERFRTSLDEVKCDKSVTKLANNAPVNENLRSSSISSYSIKQVIMCYIITITIFVICH